jgi:hypothetical protein
MSMEVQEQVDVREAGRLASGEKIAIDRRLYIQLLAFGHCPDPAPLMAALAAAQHPGALYLDINDPYGVALLTYSEEPAYFVEDLRALLQRSPFKELSLKPEYTMLGRTYTLGHEHDLVEALITRPVKRITDPTLPWAIWYPLRRAGSFEQLPAQEQNVILQEHGGIGRAFGRAGLGHDIRLACHGLDKNDNDFVVGLVGPQLHPLSAIVQRMRKTKQTSLHLERLGPFWIGKAVWQGNST